MNRTDEQSASQPPTIKVRPGLLDRLKETSGIRSDDAFARAIGISRATLDNAKKGGEPSLRTVLGIAHAFGLAMGEVVVVVEDEPAVAQPVAS
ncbi:hypothetical protein NS220_06160 [Microbacterium testaceum]|uniref:HTH cro/C1-type domain-containing protein n=1 Tax=Microbacterium testaceum TaxID=2033 RepID=A0A147EYQ8_MICTE|nr:helix-turn-helix domain-containing protein [Microbacterium testaceum]KTR95379.1 hypothetical protein NS220_06160 [Microbacterium testaceum]